MAIKTKEKNEFKILDVDSKTSEPIENVLTFLQGMGYSGKCLIDLTSLKPNKIGKQGLEKLFSELSQINNTKYFVALPSKMIEQGIEIARKYSEANSPYNILNKQSATSTINQRAN